MLFWAPPSVFCLLFFFFNDTATTEIYTLSLHDALPICRPAGIRSSPSSRSRCSRWPWRSEEHTSELQSHSDLVCRLLLEKKKTKTKQYIQNKKKKKKQQSYLRNKHN